MQTEIRSPDDPHEPNIEDLRRQGHEPNTLNMSLIWSIVAGLGVLVLVAMVLMNLMFDSLASRGRRPEQLPPSLRRIRPQPVEPSLDASQREHLRDIRAAEVAVLSSYQWIDKEKGVARIPINRAIEIIAEHGVKEPQPPPPAESADDADNNVKKTENAKTENADSEQSNDNGPS